MQTISVSIASAGVFPAAIYYIFQLRYNMKARETPDQANKKTMLEST